ncbi:MAG: LemA family protein [Candidatus Anstonellales archaeon]
MIELIALAAAVLGIAVVVWAVLTYNHLVKLSQQVKNAWHQIDVQLQRRHDLIPNLVEAVKGYMKHEKETLEEITKLRAAIVSGTPAERASANERLSSALKTIFAVAENYPQLRASENFLKLQEELTTTENRVAYARQAYNDSVYFYNTAIAIMPNNLLAMLLGMKEQEFFSTEQSSREAPKVKI